MTLMRITLFPLHALENTQILIAQGVCVGISGGYVSMHNVPNLRIQGTYLPNSYLHCFHASLGVFYVYPLLFCSLQCIYKDMYCSYLSVCLWNFQRHLEILSLYLDHTNDL